MFQTDQTLQPVCIMGWSENMYIIHMTNLVDCSDSYCRNEYKVFVLMDCYKILNDFTPLCNGVNKSTHHAYVWKRAVSFEGMTSCYIMIVNITFHKVLWVMDLSITMSFHSDFSLMTLWSFRSVWADAEGVSILCVLLDLFLCIIDAFAMLSSILYRFINHFFPIFIDCLVLHICHHLALTQFPLFSSLVPKGLIKYLCSQFLPQSLIHIFF